MADNSRDVPARPPIEHAHHPPPAHIRALHKKLQKSLDDVDILDFASPDISHYHGQRLTLSRTIRRNRAAEVFARFEAAVSGNNSATAAADTNTGAEPAADSDIPVYTHSSVPGPPPSPSSRRSLRDGWQCLASIRCQPNGPRSNVLDRAAPRALVAPAR